MKKITIIIFMSILFVSCSQQITRILPNGNLDKQRIYPDSVNTEVSEIAPYQRNIEERCEDAFYKEFSKNTNLFSEPIKPANKFMAEILGVKYRDKENILNLFIEDEGIKNELLQNFEILNELETQIIK